MRRLFILAIAVGMFSWMLPEQASAQLFRGWLDNSRTAFSNLSEADPNVRRAPDYGAEQVSEEIRNEVNGRTSVRPAPDFWSNTPLSHSVMLFLPSISYTVQRPAGEDERVQPPLTKYASPYPARPHWLLPYSEASDEKFDEISEEVPEDPGDLIPLLREFLPKPDGGQDQVVEL